jgi:hypothetical protein
MSPQPTNSMAANAAGAATGLHPLMLSTGLHPLMLSTGYVQAAGAATLAAAHPLDLLAGGLTAGWMAALLLQLLSRMVASSGQGTGGMGLAGVTGAAGMTGMTGMAGATGVTGTLGSTNRRTAGAVATGRACSTSGSTGAVTGSRTGMSSRCQQGVAAAASAGLVVRMQITSRGIARGLAASSGAGGLSLNAGSLMRMLGAGGGMMRTVTTAAMEAGTSWPGGAAGMWAGMAWMGEGMTGSMTEMEPGVAVGSMAGNLTAGRQLRVQGAGCGARCAGAQQTYRQTGMASVAGGGRHPGVAAVARAAVVTATAVGVRLVAGCLCGVGMCTAGAAASAAAGADECQALSVVHG